METPESFSLGYVTKNTQGEKQLVEAEAMLEEKKLVITSKKQKLFIPYTQIQSIVEEDYSILIRTDDDQHVLTQLGYEYENFIQLLTNKRNELLLKYMLMQERKVVDSVEAQYRYHDEDGLESEGECVVRIYESALIVLPNKDEPIRLPLSFIDEYEYEDYLLTVKTRFGHNLELSKMGENTDYFNKELEKALFEVTKRSIELLNEFAPGLDPKKISEATSLMRDGLAVSEKEIKKISPELWRLFEKKIGESGFGEEYEYLLSLTDNKETWIGAKRGLQGERTGTYLWFLIPLISIDKSRPGNALALESLSDADDGKATYLFRIYPREEYSKTGQASQKSLEDVVNELNLCMVEVNFRREPIYLQENRLNEPEYEQYRYAVKKNKSLKKLRGKYIGRVIHTTPENWKKNIRELLNSNVKSFDEN